MRLASGMYRKQNFCVAVKGLLGLSLIHCGDRWNWTTWSAALTTCGTSWAAEQPLPTTATFFHLRISSWFHRAECQILPEYFSWPGILQSFGIEIEPTQDTTISASRVKMWRLWTSRNWTCHTSRPAIQDSLTTSVPYRICGRTPNFSAVDSRYLRISG